MTDPVAIAPGTDLVTIVTQCSYRVSTGSG